MTKRLIIAVDGPAASGKGTLARRLAEHLHLAHLDTGTIYRAVAKHLLDNKKNPDDPQHALESALHIRDHLSWEMLDDKSLRSENVADATSRSSQFPAMREVLLETQRQFAHHPPQKPNHHPYQGSVLDGRDIGTIVCPDADIKFFVTADVETRAARRHKELESRGITAELSEILHDMQDRDARDSGRSTAPLKPASDAIVLDTSHLDADQALEKAIALIRTKLG